jgi:hypothetical protein
MYRLMSSHYYSNKTGRRTGGIFRGQEVMMHVNVAHGESRFAHAGTALISPAEPSPGA